MKILDFIGKEELQKMQDLFSDATGIAAIMLDAEGNYITEGSNFTEFCMKYTRGCEEGARRCRHNDETGVGCYFCHAGLMDFAEDIKIGDEVVARIIGGQVLPGTPDEDKFRGIARELGLNPDEYIEALRKVPVKSEKAIKASCELLSTMINKVVNEAYLAGKNTSAVATIAPTLQKATEVIRQITDATRNLDRIGQKQRILSLNASIEATRAGKFGAGFGVVAKEMTDLTQESTNIYKSIEDGAADLKESIREMNEAFD